MKRSLYYLFSFILFVISLFVIGISKQFEGQFLFDSSFLVVDNSFFIIIIGLSLMITSCSILIKGILIKNKFTKSEESE